MRRVIGQPATDRLDRQQRVVVGIAEHGARLVDQRPVDRRLVHRRTAEIERIGAVARRVGIAPRRHAQRVIEGDGVARIARPAGAPVIDADRFIDAGLARQHCRADQRCRDRLGDRPGALRGVLVEAGGIDRLFDEAVPFAVSPHQRSRGARSLPVLARNRCIEHLGERRRRRNCAASAAGNDARHDDLVLGRRGDRHGRLRIADILGRADREGRAAGVRAEIGGDARGHVLGPFDRDMGDLAGRAADDFVGQIGEQRVVRGLDAGQLPRRDAFGRAGGAVALGNGDGAAQHQRLVACRDRPLVARAKRLLLALGEGGCGGEEQRGSGKRGADHGAHPTPPAPKEKGRRIAPGGPVRALVEARLMRLRIRPPKRPGPNPGPWQLRHGRPVR